MNVSVPAGPFQSRRGNEGVSAIISFAAKDEAIPGAGKELLDRSRDSGASLIHERFGGDATGKRGIFCVTHLRRGKDRRVHCSSELTFFFGVLEDFFLVEVL